MTTYPAPGRGAWTTTGGLLTARPQQNSTVGYYRLATIAETPIGQSYVSGKDTSHPALCVLRGVMAVQDLVGAKADGVYGPITDQFVRAAQLALHIENDGIVGRATMHAALAPIVSQVAAVSGVPVSILGGLVTLESALDPAAVGVNGQDHGLAQINLAAHPEVALYDALDPEYSLRWAAAELAHVHATWDGKTKGGVDAWDIAIANHNSPALAREWAAGGAAPIVVNRVIQIADYVAKVKTSW